MAELKARLYVLLIMENVVKNIWQIYLVTTLELIKQTSKTQEMKVNKMLLKNQLCSM